MPADHDNLVTLVPAEHNTLNFPSFAHGLNIPQLLACSIFHGGAQYK